MGRPRSFNIETALDRALRVFWCKGYEGASLSDLTRAMRINRPSLYGAFGNKEALFLRALDRYANGPAAFTSEALKASTARGVVERLWYGAADMQTGLRTPPGCLTVHGALACGEAADPVRRKLISSRHALEAALRQRFERAQSYGDLPTDSSPADLARYVVAIVHGMAVQAAGGASRDELQGIIRVALQAWPS